MSVISKFIFLIIISRASHVLHHVKMLKQPCITRIYYLVEDAVFLLTDVTCSCQAQVQVMLCYIILGSTLLIG